MASQAEFSSAGPLSEHPLETRAAKDRSALGIGGLDVSEEEVDEEAAPRDDSFVHKSHGSTPVMPSDTSTHPDQTKVEIGQGRSNNLRSEPKKWNSC